MLVLPPVIAELSPAIMGLALAALGWGAAMYTKRHARDRSER